MSNTAQKRQREKEMVSQMIALYCRKHHGGKGGLCPQCRALEEYARPAATNAPLWRKRPSAQTVRCTATSRRCGRKSGK